MKKKINTIYRNDFDNLVNIPQDGDIVLLKKHSKYYLATFHHNDTIERYDKTLHKVNYAWHSDNGWYDVEVGDMWIYPKYIF